MEGIQLLSDQPSPVSSFIPLFNYFQAKGFQLSRYYSSTLLPNWAAADELFWNSSALNQNSLIRGRSVLGHLWGSGAGPDYSHQYIVDKIDESGSNKFASAAIMAGFLCVKDASRRSRINSQLRWLWDNEVCTYNKTIGTGSSQTMAKILWRCSADVSSYDRWWVTSIDYSTFWLGYALNFLPSGFYSQYAA